MSQKKLFNGREIFATFSCYQHFTLAVTLTWHKYLLTFFIFSPSKLHHSPWRMFYDCQSSSCFIYGSMIHCHCFTSLGYRKNHSAKYSVIFIFIFISLTEVFKPVNFETQMAHLVSSQDPFLIKQNRETSVKVEAW